MSCASPPASFPHAPIILISIDTLRSDHLPAYGYSGLSTPAIDALRADSILFERAYAHTPLTLPSHLTILTGTLPAEHGVHDNAGYHFDPARVPSVTQALRTAGYATGASVSTFVLRKETGMGAGFDFYQDEMRPDLGASPDRVERRGDVTVRLALHWLADIDRGSPRPPFLLVHLYEPHFPYQAGPDLDSRASDAYDREIAIADRLVGDLITGLQRLGLYERAIVILLSDHGEGLGEHGELQHGVFLYRESLQVPLLVKLPESRRGGQVVREPAQLLDVAPTVLELAGIASATPMAGRNLLELSGRPSRPIVAETVYPRLHFGWSDLRSVLRGRYHYIEGARDELFDLEEDPGEHHDLASVERRVRSELRAVAAAHRRALEAPAASSVEEVTRLGALGYLSAGRLGGEDARPDPRDRRAIVTEIQAGAADFANRRYGDARARFERVLAIEPRMLEPLGLLGMTCLRLGDRAAALRAFENAVEVSGGDPEFARVAAQIRAAMGRGPIVGPASGAGR